MNKFVLWNKLRPYLVFLLIVLMISGVKHLYKEHKEDTGGPKIGILSSDDREEFQQISMGIKDYFTNQMTIKDPRLIEITAVGNENEEEFKELAQGLIQQKVNFLFAIGEKAEKVLEELAPQVTMVTLRQSEEEDPFLRGGRGALKLVEMMSSGRKTAKF